MRFVLFYHSLISDWDHRDATFLRAIAEELTASGHAVTVFEPADGASARQLRDQCGEGPIKAFHAVYPRLRSTLYTAATLDLPRALDGADVVIVHNRTDPLLVRRIGRHRAGGGRYRLLFHETRHALLRSPPSGLPDGLAGFDAVLARGDALRRLYAHRDWTADAWTWHEAADMRIFKPQAGTAPSLDLVWISDYNEGERAGELGEFFIDPVRALGLRARLFGAGYPEPVLHSLQRAGIDYAGWVPSFRLPAIFASARVTLHVPHRTPGEDPYGMPALRVFEALACRSALLTTPWSDWEGMFEPGRDFLVAGDAPEVRRQLRRLLAQPAFAQMIAAHGHRTVLERHTCAHRARRLLAICRELGADEGEEPAAGEQPAAQT